MPRKTFTRGLMKYPRLDSTIWSELIAQIYVNQLLPRMNDVIINMSVFG